MASNAVLDFILRLLRDEEAAAAYCANPQASLAAAGLGDLCHADIAAVAPMVAESGLFGSAAGDLGAILAAGTTAAGTIGATAGGGLGLGGGLGGSAGLGLGAGQVSAWAPRQGRLHRRLRLRRRHRRCPRGGAGGRWLDRAQWVRRWAAPSSRSGTGRRTGPGRPGGHRRLDRPRWGAGHGTGWGARRQRFARHRSRCRPERGVRGRGQLGSGWTPVGRRRVERRARERIRDRRCAGWGARAALGALLGAAVEAGAELGGGLGAGFDAALDSALALGGSLGGALGGDLAASWVRR